ncbi:hypothetical protein [Deinococcus arenicola]|uniref:Uncharacterized protein n=1 Tax=Deinococcus arenicola TaxID=2994950 RepID=A0ABU4DTZ7_9DEIO|nr:hypothetical protein [Deinococcus sp. ZS9-10]MDV6375897.1 hypothetical protein [Deinococcus sp. ZS9-10]
MNMAQLSWLDMGTQEDPGTEYSLDDSGARQAALFVMYNALYAELRDKDTRTKDVVTWGVTGLTGSVFLGALSNYKDLTHTGSNAQILAVVVFCGVLCLTIIRLAEDRASIARILNRMHQVMGVFKNGVYVKNSTLFPPNWRGWGHNTWRDEVYWQSRIYVILLILIALAAIAMVLGLSDRISIFNS